MADLLTGGMPPLVRTPETGLYLDKRHVPRTGTVGVVNDIVAERRRSVVRGYDLHAATIQRAAGTDHAPIGAPH